jgi:hypothetical protein
MSPTIDDLIGIPHALLMVGDVAPAHREQACRQEPYKEGAI